MKKLALLLFAWLSLPSLLSAQPQFRSVTWNLENLFDCRDDSLKLDEEFLPESERQWTWGRYWRKVEDVSRVLMDIGGDVPPALVALQEVENDSTLIALTKRGALRALGYEYVMTDSPDERGVDVALLYQPMMFRLIGWRALRVPSAERGLRPTRDLLYAWGRVRGGDTLHVVVCHLPSRLGGREGKLNRQLAVEKLTSLADSLLINPHCLLMVMGDFNATLRDKSLRPIVRPKASDSPDLLPLTPNQKRPLDGTYRFKGNWSWIDHILVSKCLSEKVRGKVCLFTRPWMQRQMSDGTWYPRRTYMGTNYNGGVSDHVPIYCDFDW